MRINAYSSLLLYWITGQHEGNRVARFPHRVIGIYNVIEVIVIVDKLWNILRHGAAIEVVNESFELGTFLLVDDEDIANADIPMENPGLTR